MDPFRVVGQLAIMPTVVKQGSAIEKDPT